MSETGPAARAAYLASLDEAERMGRQRPARRPEYRGITGRLADAEELLAQTEADWERASQIAADARADFRPGIEHAYERHLDPDQRHRLVVALDAEAACRDAEQAYLEARHKLNPLVPLTAAQRRRPRFILLHELGFFHGYNIVRLPDRPELPS